MFVSARLAAAVAVVALAPLAVPGAALPTLAVGVALLAALAGGDVARAPAPGALGIEREVNEAVTIGEQTPVAVHVRNPAGRRVRLAVHDATAPSLGRTPRRQAAAIPPRSPATLRSTITPRRRGDHGLGPATVRVTAGLGLAGRQRRIELPGRVRVFPRLPGRAAVELRLDRARLLQTGERATRIRGGGTEFDSLREYHPDDEFRRINWQATARAGKPISNVYREERNQQVVALLDAGRGMAATVGDTPRVELAIDGAMAVAELAARVGDHVGALAFAARVEVMLSPRAGRPQARRILGELFDLEPSLDAPGYRHAFATLLRRHRRRMLLVLLTDLPGEGAIGSLLDALPALATRHLVIVGAVRDPAVVAQARMVPRSSDEVYTKAAAVQALEEREQAAGHLRHLGAFVVDAPPDEFAGRLADRYLHLKAWGRL